MTYHAYVGEDEEDVHPEEPDRIVGIHQRLQGESSKDYPIRYYGCERHLTSGHRRWTPLAHGPNRYS